MICPAILVQSIRTKIQEDNSKLFSHLHQIKTRKLEQLTGPPITCYSSLESLSIIISIPENIPLSDAEKSVLHSKTLTDSWLSKMLKNFFATFNLKYFSMIKRMILRPWTKVFSRRFRLENRSGLPQRASLPLLIFSSLNAVTTSINWISIVTSTV